MNFFDTEYENRELNYNFPEDCLLNDNKLFDDEDDIDFNEQSYTTKS